MGNSRVRFAPSPTGNVHIGNIRVAIYNWLFARHEGGSFLLRVEDTDRERCTPAAIDNLFQAMQWLGLSYDEEPLYQTARLQEHIRVAEELIESKNAYRSAKGGKGEAVLMRIPWDASEFPEIEEAGAAELDVHPATPVTVDRTGINYALVSKKGKPMPQNGCLAGFRQLEIFDSGGETLFTLEDEYDKLLLSGESRTVEGAVKMRFRRRQVVFDDLIRGRLAKPLDTMRDQVIVRSDGYPVFHLANVCDDHTMGITHIIRGDDHVENTYRHVLLYRALGVKPPLYVHLPMIVNAQGKPYSKRDGAAFVGEFREKGYLPEALFNYLALLGWSPGDDREKLSREELVRLFTLDRVQKGAARMDMKKLDNLNGQYMAEMPVDEFVKASREFAENQYPWAMGVDSDYWRQVATLMQSRAKRFDYIEDWKHFFIEIPEYDEKACRKFLADTAVKKALEQLLEKIDEQVMEDWTALEQMINATAVANGLKEGKLNQPLRVALTGMTTGAGIFETMDLLGYRRIESRLRYVFNNYCPDTEG